MLTYFQAIVFGMLQGITELFPISSLGHSVILPKLLHWNINQKDPFFVTFLVATHFATATVLFIFFYKDWSKIIRAFFTSLKEREIKISDSYQKLAWLIIIGTIPAGLLGLLFEDFFKTFFSSPRLVAVFLILNGLMFILVEKLNKNDSSQVESGSDNRIAKLTFFQAFKVGCAQALALIPGFSRTGSAITGGLLLGLSHEDSARFSFLLATPIIGAAAVLKLPELATNSSNIAIGPIIVGAIFSGIFAYLAIKFLVKYFSRDSLVPFGIYCVLAGVVASLLFL